MAESSDSVTVTLDHDQVSRSPALAVALFFALAIALWSPLQIRYNLVTIHDGLNLPQPESGGYIMLVVKTVTCSLFVWVNA